MRLLSALGMATAIPGADAGVMISVAKSKWRSFCSVS
jgi:hypothetical protein